jgi:hypothetical protein
MYCILLLNDIWRPDRRSTAKAAQVMQLRCTLFMNLQFNSDRRSTAKAAQVMQLRCIKLIVTVSALQ